MGAPILKRTSALKGKGTKRSYYDYEAFIAKFQNLPKTTDDTYTPEDVYEAVLDYVNSIYPLEGKVVLRPFYPGGDYVNEDYPENCVVVDNPPFSLFTKICAFYSANKVPFFLFGPGLTITSCAKYCTAVIVGFNVKFENSAAVCVNFASNLFGDTAIMTAPELYEALEECPSQNKKVNLPSYAYPEELLSVSTMQTIAAGGVHFRVSRGECVKVNGLDNHPNGRGALFGDHFLIAKAKAVIPIRLSQRERRIVDSLAPFNTAEEDD